MKTFLATILMVISMNAFPISVFFGHNSVGENILHGFDTLDAKDIVIFDEQIGENRDPVSKMKEFEEFVDKYESDIAIMKFCYLDIENTNPAELAVSYIEMVKRIQEKHPRLIILHMTMPLVNNPYNKDMVGKIKGVVRRILGRSPYDVKLNEQRNAFNRVLLAAYGDKVFDLAYIESNGGVYKEDGVLSLSPYYSDDNQHLNKLGRELVAEEFVTFLREQGRNSTQE